MSFLDKGKDCEEGRTNLIGDAKVVRHLLQRLREVLPSMRERNMRNIEKVLLHLAVLLVMGVDAHERAMVLRCPFVRALIESSGKLL